MLSPFANHAEKLKADFLPRKHKLFINNQWVDPVDGGTLDVYNPSTKQKLATVAAGNAKDIDLAVKAAEKAFHGPWSKFTAAQRTAIMHKLADLMEANIDELSTLEVMDAGNPIMHVRHGDIAMAVAYLRYYAGWTDKLFGQVPMSNSGPEMLSYSTRQPVGVAAAITPWNAPMILSMFKIAPTLASGCTFVHKPAELAPMTALRFCELVLEAGIPEGVFNVVTGTGPEAGAPLASHPGVAKVGFTGSTATGAEILRLAAPTFKRVTLELGGKSPVFMFPDCDVEAAIAGISNGIFYKTGQFCAAGTRLYIHDKIYDKVVAGFEKHAKAAKVGQPLETDTTMGPIISQKQLDRVTNYLQIGRDEGGEIVTGGNLIPGDGYFIEPTLIANVDQTKTLVKEEIFGPVLVAQRFTDAHDLDTLAAWGNDTQYGLAARIWTTNLRNAHGLAARLDAGTITINNGFLGDLDFGGFKSSGLGRELGQYGIESYLEHKSIAVGF
ncbi:aldehyde dehydrogenase family protein [Sphingomonas crocodyli]|uniref:Aldehyde dehydrogenase family protein n=1 Tax=Sphingomonas crocodyli TaxID=1979270 RepID=A0A437LVB3_9SPHN|nr:aldehyde dehydrogenase family protein [Sphingomonas crocodyli]RVT89312.1 aldehyde dehydrogenase family protein [Sphingomonas crocodyli]